MDNNFESPLILSAAARLFGIDTRWLRKRAAKGEIRSKKVGHHTIVEEDEVRALVDDRLLIERALERQRELEADAEKGKVRRSTKRGRKD